MKSTIYVVTVEFGDEYYTYSVEVAYAGNDYDAALKNAAEHTGKSVQNIQIEFWEDGEMVKCSNFAP